LARHQAINKVEKRRKEGLKRWQTENPVNPVKEFLESVLISGSGWKSEIGSCESGEWFFTCAFLFATSHSYEGGEKRTTAKNKALLFKK